MIHRYAFVIVGILFFMLGQSTNILAQNQSNDLEELIACPDPTISKNASTLKSGLRERAWTYTGVDGKQRTHRDRFLAISSSRSQQIVEFETGAKIPLEMLSPSDRKWIGNIERYQEIVRQDRVKYKKMVAEAERQARMRAEAETRRRQEELDRTDPLVTIAQTLVETQGNVLLNGQESTVNFSQGESFIVLEKNQNVTIVASGGQQAALPTRALQFSSVRTSQLPASFATSYSAMRPQISNVPNGNTNQGGTSNQTGWPRKLDCDVTYESYPDGKPGIHVLVNSVFSGGAGDRMGFKAGDRIIQANGRRMMSQEDFRKVVFSQTAPVFHVVDRFGQSHIRRFAAVSQPQAFSGVKGHKSQRGEFVVDVVTQHDKITSQLQLSRDDTILAVNNQSVGSVQEIIQALKMSNGKSKFIILKPGQRAPISVIVAH